MPAQNNNAARKIERAARLGWTPALRCGPARFSRLRRAERRATLRILRHARPDNAWRPVTT